MKNITNFILKLISVLTVVAQVIFSIASIMLVFATVMMFFISGETQSDFDKYMLQPQNLTKMSLVMGCLLALIILISLMVTMRSLRKVINNISQKNFFVQINLNNIKIMLISVSIFTLSNIGSMFMFASAHATSISSVFANSWGQIGIYVIFIAILYTIYLVFKYGVELQNDSNTVI